MSTRFRSTSLIVVRGIIKGPEGQLMVRLALDTGSTRTTIDSGMLASVGIRPNSSSRRFRLTTASGSGTAREVVVSKSSALEHERFEFPVLSYRLREASVNGVVGLDFLRNHVLTIDFRNNEITLV